MNRKYLLLLFIIFFSLVLSLSFVSAAKETSVDKNKNINNNTSSDGIYSSKLLNKNSKGIHSSKVLGRNSNGYVKCIELGNRSSKVKIAYIIGIHPREKKPHKAVYKQILSKSKSGKLKYRYFVYSVVVTKNPYDFNVGRMNGQKLAKKYVLPHSKRAGYDLVLDIHSTKGPIVGYKKKYFVFAPLNKYESKKIAKKLTNSIFGLSYYYPKVQTSPSYCTNHLVKFGTKTIVYETYMLENQSTTNKKIRKLIKTVDKLFK